MCGPRSRPRQSPRRSSRAARSACLPGGFDAPRQLTVERFEVRVTLAQLRDQRVELTARIDRVPSTGQVQFFLRDPASNGVELQSEDAR